MASRIHAMSSLQIAALPKVTRDKMFGDTLVYAISQSVQYNNCDVAKSLLKCLPFVNKKAGAKDALIKFFETWGNLHYDKTHDLLRHKKRHKPEIWTPEHEQHLIALNWADAIEDTKATKIVYDADDEFRTVLMRLKKVAEDPERILLHKVLLEKIEEAIYAYGRTDTKLNEEKRGRTLFDASTKMSTMRAGKYAKVS